MVILVVVAVLAWLGWSLLGSSGDDEAGDGEPVAEKAPAEAQTAADSHEQELANEAADPGAGDEPAAPAGDRVWPREPLAIRDGAGREVVVLRPDGDRMQLVGDGGEELARYARTGTGAIEAKAGDTFVAAVRRRGEQLQVRRSPDEEREFDLRPRDDRFLLRTREGERLATIRPRDDGWRIDSGRGETRFRVEAAESETSVRGASGDTMYATGDRVDALALACLGFEELSLEQRVALLLAVDREARQAP